MADTSLEERVALLEDLMAQLLPSHERVERPKDWRRTVGTFDGDHIMHEIIAEGERVRAADRQASHL